MKQGDTVPVTISGQVVAQAVVKELGEGTATLMVPATLVVMAVRTEIAPEAVVPEGHTAVPPTSETIITGVDRASGEVEPVTNADVPMGTPELQMPPITPPSNDVPGNGPSTPVVEPVEQVSPVVSDAPNEPQ